MKIYDTDKNGNPTFWSTGDFSLRNYEQLSKSTLLQEGYLMNAYMSMLCNAIGDKVASLPKMFCDAEGGTVDNAETQAFLELLDSGEGKKALLDKCGTSLASMGEFFIGKVTGVGMSRPTELWVLSPACVELNTKSGEAWDTIESYQVSNYYKNQLLPEEMIFGKLPNLDTDTQRGLSPFEPAWDVVQASNNAFQAHAWLVRNMGANGFVSPKVSSGDVSAIGFGKEERNFLQKTVDKWFGSFGRSKNRASNFGKTAVSNVGLDFTQIGMDAQKLQILEMNKENLKVLSACIKLDSKLFNDAEASTYNNMPEVEKSAYLDAYIPMANYVCGTIAKNLLPEGIYWKVDTEQIDILNQRNQSREKETREGIIQVQNQVAEGKITVESGVKMLELVYDFDEDTASELLQIPQQQQPSETIIVDENE